MKLSPDILQVMRHLANAMAVTALLALLAVGVVSCQTVLEHRAQAACAKI